MLKIKIKRIVLILCFVIIPVTSYAQSNRLLVHMVTDANKNDADACIAFNIAWVAVEKGFPVEMLFDSWAAYNIKRGDFWSRFKVPHSYRKLVITSIGKDILWKGGSYLNLLKYLKKKGMVISTNQTFLSLSNDHKKIPQFIERINLMQMVERIKNASGYVRY